MGYTIPYEFSNKQQKQDTIVIMPLAKKTYVQQKLYEQTIT